MKNHSFKISPRPLKNTLWENSLEWVCKSLKSSLLYYHFPTMIEHQTESYTKGMCA